MCLIFIGWTNKLVNFVKHLSKLEKKKKNRQRMKEYGEQKQKREIFGDINFRDFIFIFTNL